MKLEGEKIVTTPTTTTTTTTKTIAATATTTKRTKKETIFIRKFQYSNLHGNQINTHTWFDEQNTKALEYKAFYRNLFKGN